MIEVLGRPVIIDPMAFKNDGPRWRHSPHRSKRVLKKIIKRLRKAYGSEYILTPTSYVLRDGTHVMHPSIAASMKSVRDRPGFDIERAIRQTRGLR